MSMDFLNEVDMGVILQVEELEKKFSNNGYNGSGYDWFELCEGDIPIMISAPHTVNHFSRGKVKYAEILTGGIAEYLQRQTNCHLMYTACYEDADANRDSMDICLYKQKLLEYVLTNNIKLLIDLHGMKINSDYAIELGTGGYGNPTLIGHGFIADTVEEVVGSSLRKYLDEDNKQIVRNVRFVARGENTITNFISRKSRIPCLQLEIGGEYRDSKKPERLEALISGLQSVIEILVVNLE